MDAQIVGTVMPVLEVALNPGEVVFSESGELSWMTASVQMRTSTQAGGGGGIGGVFKRAVAGGSIFMTEYTAAGQPGMVAFAAKLPGTIFPVDVAPQPGMTFMAHRHGFLCGTQGVNLGIGFQQSVGAGIFGGLFSPGNHGRGQVDTGDVLGPGGEGAGHQAGAAGHVQDGVSRAYPGHLQQ